MFRSPALLIRLLFVAILSTASMIDTVPAYRLQERAVTPAGQRPAPVETAVQPAQTIEPAGVHVTLSAAQVTSSWNSRLIEPVEFELPVVYLNRNGVPAAEVDRTLEVSLSGPPGGAAVELEIVSWNVNRATWEHERQVKHFELPARDCRRLDPCVVQLILDGQTLSDYYRFNVYDGQGDLLWENPDPERPDLVALDTWEVALDGHTLRVIYARLFGFARGEKALYHRLTPGAVPEFIAGQIVPMLVDTWRTQFDAWGFGPIHADWDADKVVEVIFVGRPFALFGGTGTYTASTYSDGSPYPERRIWIQPDHNTLQAYDTLENGFKVLLSHEFYHMVQWNVRLSTGCIERKWVSVFLEAQAAAAVSVQYPELELSREHLTIPASGYSSAAERYLVYRMDTSYAEMEADPVHLYDAALYWRFLYEQFDDMRALRYSLEEMVCRPVADALDEVMDAALARLDGPHADGQGWDFAESLLAFARANYALRLADGRCAAENVSECEGRYYDPHGMYVSPIPEAVLLYDGSSLEVAGSIPASFGTDLIEVSLDSKAESQPIEVVVRSERALLDVRVWRLSNAGDKMRALTPQPERLTGDCRAGCRYAFPGEDRAQADRLAVIVVRLDANEETDDVGAYLLRVAG